MSYLSKLNNLGHLRVKIKILRVIGNERRLAILVFLAQNEKLKLGWTVSEISKKLKIPYKLASHHLQLLENKELVDRARVGKEVEYMTSDLGKYLLTLIDKF